MLLHYLRMAGIMVGTIHTTTIGIDHIMVGIHIGVGTSRSIGGIHILITVHIIIDLHIIIVLLTTSHLIMAA